MKISIFVFLFFLISCSGDNESFKQAKVFVGNQKVPAHVLNLGKQVYLEYCMACHGREGDGNGPAAKGSIPAPRNFKQGLYKFGLVADGELPTDEDFKRIIKHGLSGTAMLKWDISDDQTYAVTQYIKTFAPQVWEVKDGSVGKPVELEEDPFTIARKESAIAKGKEVYHMLANCQTCHKAYISKDELSLLNEKYNGEPLDEFDEDLYQPKLQVSEYYFYDSEERMMKFLPPDFTWHKIRSASSVEDIAYRLAAGVTGTGMPAWKETIADHEIWAVSYYVKYLMDMRGKEERKKVLFK